MLNIRLNITNSVPFRKKNLQRGNFGGGMSPCPPLPYTQPTGAYTPLTVELHRRRRCVFGIRSRGTWSTDRLVVVCRHSGMRTCNVHHITSLIQQQAARSSIIIIASYTTAQNSGLQRRQWVSGSNGSTNVNGSCGSRVSAVKHLTNDWVRCKRVRGKAY